MSQVGKEIRLNKFFSKGNAVIITVDHGGYFGPLPGIENIREIVSILADTDIDGILVNIGIVPVIKDIIKKLNIIVRLDSSTSIKSNDFTEDYFIASVEDCVRYGADMCIVNVYLGCKNENMLLKKQGEAYGMCSHYGIPLMVEVFDYKNLDFHITNNKIDAKIKFEKMVNKLTPEDILFDSRVVLEKGADLVKTYYAGDKESHKKVVSSCPVPILIAGGPNITSDREFLEVINNSIDSGGKGVTIGRFIWHEQSNIRERINAICKLVHDRKSIDYCLSMLTDCEKIQ